MTTATSEKKLTVARAMAAAVAQEMRLDPKVFVMGEDIGQLGGVFGNTRGLYEEFGKERIRDTRRRRCRLGRHAADRRADVRRLLRRLHGRHLQPDG